MFTQQFIDEVSTMRILCYSACGGRGTTNSASGGRGTTNSVCGGRGTTNSASGGRGTTNSASGGRGTTNSVCGVIPYTTAFEVGGTNAMFTQHALFTNCAI